MVCDDVLGEALAAVVLPPGDFVSTGGCSSEGVYVPIAVHVGGVYGHCAVEEIAAGNSVFGEGDSVVAPRSCDRDDCALE